MHRGIRPLLLNEAIVIVNTHWGTTNTQECKVVVLTGTSHPTSSSGFPRIALEDA
jgi:hypothetical protein